MQNRRVIIRKVIVFDVEAPALLWGIERWDLHQGMKIFQRLDLLFQIQVDRFDLYSFREDHRGPFRDARQRWNDTIEVPHGEAFWYRYVFKSDDIIAKFSHKLPKYAFHTHNYTTFPDIIG